MKTEIIETPNLKLLLQTAEDIRAMIDGLTASERAQISADWLALVNGATSPNPWVHGFALIHKGSNAAIGTCGFKGPPNGDGAVEIAYGIAPEYRGNGYATEATQALVAYAFRNNTVRVVLAHTLSEPSASTRVLTKSGFRHVGEVMDPDDGLVWRWEKHRETA